MGKTVIRRADSSDFREIAEILGNDLGYPCEEELVKKRLSQLDGGREAVFAAVSEGKLAGVVHIEKYELLYFETAANILGLAVRSEFRRQGIGRSLMEAAEDWARENGAAAVRLCSGGTRLDAHKFYRSIGFESEKTQIRFMKSLEEKD